MYTVISVHTLCIVFIEVYNYIYYINLDKCIKYGFAGLVYQAIKFLVLTIDLLMVYRLWTILKFYFDKNKTLTAG
jgi:hypothetical protein